MMAVKSNGWALQFASEELREDKELIAEAEKQKESERQKKVQRVKGKITLAGEKAKELEGLKDEKSEDIEYGNSR